MSIITLPSLANHNWNAASDRVGRQFINPFGDGARVVYNTDGNTQYFRGDPEVIVGDGHVVSEGTRHSSHPVDGRRHGLPKSPSGGVTRQRGNACLTEWEREQEALRQRGLKVQRRMAQADKRRAV